MRRHHCPARRRRRRGACTDCRRRGHQPELGAEPGGVRNASFRCSQAALAAPIELLGTTSLELQQFPDNRLDSVDLLDVVKAVEAFVDKCKPHTVYTHWPFDLNVDHRVVSEAVQTACRPVPQSNHEQMLFFEVPSSTEWRLSAGRTFEPNYFVDISGDAGVERSGVVGICERDARAGLIPVRWRRCKRSPGGAVQASA